jgi:hypothetical protein
MRFEYRVTTLLPQERVAVEVYLTHSTGDRLIGTLTFDQDGTTEYALWKTSMQWNPMQVLIEPAPTK